ncbi:ABC transporter permease [Shivajiella indica]|uniref:ABC transporter permease n=1 Tax=Shivajiella indica TaxID=872115 RepID=A0ABW5B5X0_9BACT
MKTLLLLSWKNVWRNKTRSLALMLAITLGIAAGLIMFGLMEGMIMQRFEGLVQNQLAHIQIHQNKYLSEQENSLIIQDLTLIKPSLDTISTLKGYAFRTISHGMIASGYYSSGVKILGLDKKEESRISRFPENITDGTYLADSIKNPVVISQRLAKKLRVKIGGRLVLTFQDLEGNITSAAFRVSGLFRTSNSNFDDVNVMVKREDLQQLLGNKDAFHQVAILITDHTKAAEVAKELDLKLPNSEVRSWETLSPELRILVEQGGFIMYIFMIIILLGLAFGILNTMLMAVFERIQELGMLMALGMQKAKIAAMIMMETLFIAIIGGIIGICLGILLIKAFETKGLDFSRFADALAEFGYEAVTYPKLATEDIIITLLLVFATSILSAIIPALRAVQLNPAEAIRK